MSPASRPTADLDLTDSGSPPPGLVPRIGPAMPSTRQHEVSREALGAVRVGISKSGESVRNIKGVWVAEQKVDVEGGEIVAFRVLPKISFVVD